jgi:CspA family cold shock protein
MRQGTVKFFNTEKGYGFITQENGKDLFVHAKAIKSGVLNEGSIVEYEVIDGKKGPEASNVSVVG